MPGTFEREVVLPTLRRASLTLGRPVCATWLVAWLEIDVPERTLRMMLCRLERAGLVVRPCGPRSGWAVMH